MRRQVTFLAGFVLALSTLFVVELFEQFRDWRPLERD